MLELGGGRRTPYVQQNEASECALACLAMVAGYHGYETDLAMLRQRYSVSLKGATLKQLMAMAETLGFSVRPLRGDINDLGHLELPAIVHWDLNHFVVLTRVERRPGRTRYHIHDPAKGVLKLTRDEMSKYWTGVALELVKAETFKPKVERAQLQITQLWSSMSGFWTTAGSILALSLLLQLAALAAPFYLQIAIDTVAPSADPDLLLMLAMGFGGIALLSLITTWLRSLVLLSLNSSLSYQIVVNLFRHLTRLPLSWFEKRHVGDIISRFGSTQPVTQLLSEGMIAAFIDGLMALLTLALMFVYSPLLSAVILTTATAYLGVRIAFLHGIRLANINAITATARENSLFIESIRGISAIKAFGQEGNRQRLWQRAKAKAINANVRLRRLTAGFDAAGHFVLGIEQIVFVYLAVSLALKGQLTFGMIFAFQAYKQQFLDASARLTEQWMNYKVMQVHLGRLSDVALSRTEDDGRSSSSDVPNFSAGIELKGVRFRYGAGDPEILKGVSVRIKHGDMVAFVGPSGGGKTTLLKIMMGLFEPTSGQVLIGGRPLASFSRAALRSRIGSIAQDDALYAGSLAENISFFDPNIDMDRVVEVAQLAAIDDDIQAMPLRYDTLVGDMGSALSGGQKQRVLLARALYAKPDILFMDEGTANLDPFSEQRVLKSLSDLSITRILVAHRPALSKSSHLVYLIQDGIAQPVASVLPQIDRSHVEIR